MPVKRAIRHKNDKKYYPRFVSTIDIRKTKNVKFFVPFVHTYVYAKKFKNIFKSNIVLFC